MLHGDFTELAKEYIHRPSYCKYLLMAIAKYINYEKKDNFQIIDVGAGTGKLTKDLLELGFNKIIAVEPNSDMRKEGINYTKDYHIKWYNGTAEETGLQTNSANWVLMGSSFHWTDPLKSLSEFYRILKPGSALTVLWNPRNLESSELHMRIEKIIYEIAPNIKRISSGSAKYTAAIENTLVSTGNFENVLFMEAKHELNMSKDRYLGAWRSVNDIRVQVGEKKWNEILETIADEIRGLDEIVVPYKTRAWTVTRV